MTRRPELRTCYVTERAALRRIHLVMAHQAVGHPQERRPYAALRIFNSVMARQARVVGVKLAPEIAGRRQVCPLVDRSGDDRRDVAHLQVCLMTERLQL